MLTNCDDCVAVVTPSFPLTIYGKKYATITVSSNGNVQLGTGPKATNGELPLPSPHHQQLTGSLGI